MYKRFNAVFYKPLSDEVFQEKLKWVTENRDIVFDAKYTDVYGTKVDVDDKVVNFNNIYTAATTAFIHPAQTKIYLTYKQGDEWYNYYYDACQPDGEQLVSETDGGTSYRKLQRFAHIPNLKNKYGYEEYATNTGTKVIWDINNLGQSPYINLKGEIRLPEVYVYDEHRAYLRACIGLYPDTKAKPKTWTRVGDNEVGFDSEGVPILEDDGISHAYVFPLIKMPGIEKWANKMDIEIRKLSRNKTKNAQQLKNLKDEYTFAIGMIARHNPFVRNMIVYRCEEYIKNLRDENTIYGITDSIFSLTPRDGLVLGDKMGEFSFEGKGEFVKTSAGYLIRYDDNRIKKGERGGDISTLVFNHVTYHNITIDHIFNFTDYDMCRTASTRKFYKGDAVLYFTKYISKTARDNKIGELI